MVNLLHEIEALELPPGTLRAMAAWLCDLADINESGSNGTSRQPEVALETEEDILDDATFGDCLLEWVQDSEVLVREPHLRANPIPHDIPHELAAASEDVDAEHSALMCNACTRLLPREQFSGKQLRRSRVAPERVRCQSCIGALPNHDQPIVSSTWSQELAKDAVCSTSSVSKPFVAETEEDILDDATFGDCLLEWVQDSEVLVREPHLRANPIPHDIPHELAAASEDVDAEHSALMCNACTRLLPREQFSGKQLRRSRVAPERVRCQSCIGALPNHDQPIVSSTWSQELAKDAVCSTSSVSKPFVAALRSFAALRDVYRCGKCDQQLPPALFSNRQLKGTVQGRDPICKTCTAAEIDARAGLSSIGRLPSPPANRKLLRAKFMLELYDLLGTRGPTALTEVLSRHQVFVKRDAPVTLEALGIDSLEELLRPEWASAKLCRYDHQEVGVIIYLPGHQPTLPRTQELTKWEKQRKVTEHINPLDTKSDAHNPTNAAFWISRGYQRRPKNWQSLIHEMKEKRTTD